MHNRYLLPLLAVLNILLILPLSCTKESGKGAVFRSAYYWSTTFALDTAQQGFIHRESISKLYLRYFDVVVDADGKVMPNATVRFLSGRPKGVEIVPTVYIMNNCMDKNISNLDSLLLHRVLQMNETNDIDSVGELQIDCDWTINTRDKFFSFLENLSYRALQKGIKLSVTIRLHQLSQPVPPVSRGVLMMYNTGDVREAYNDRNPILDMRDVRPYLRYLKDYDLSLSTAYPVFAWNVLYRDGKYVGILHGDDEFPVIAGDVVKVFEPSLNTVIEARDAVGSNRADANAETVLFDISSKNIQRINQYHYEKVYSN